MPDIDWEQFVQTAKNYMLKTGNDPLPALALHTTDGFSVLVVITGPGWNSHEGRVWLMEQFGQHIGRGDWPTPPGHSPKGEVDEAGLIVMGWMVVVKKPASEAEVLEIQPSQHPDRKEILCLTRSTGTGKGTMRIYEVEHGADGPVFVERKQEEGTLRDYLLDNFWATYEQAKKAKEAGE